MLDELYDPAAAYSAYYEAASAEDYQAAYGDYAAALPLYLSPEGEVGAAAAGGEEEVYHQHVGGMLRYDHVGGVKFFGGV